MAKKKKTQLGKLSPQHTFFLNPYPDERFTRCPGCGATMKARKKPFLIHIDPNILLVFNLTGRYCPNCDLIILHRDVLENYLTQAFERFNPAIIGNDYLVIGTVEREGWKSTQKQPMNYAAVFANLHDFKEAVIYQPQNPHWGPTQS